MTVINHMKNLIILIFLLPFYSISQENVTSFKVENGSQLVWDRVIQKNVNPSDFFQYLESTGYFNNITKTDSTFTANFNGVKCDYKSAGLTRMSIPIMYADSEYSGGVLIQVREGRYRVVLRNISMAMQATNFQTTLDLNETLNSNVKNGQIKKSFIKKPALALEVTFRNIFTVNDTEREW